MMELGRCLLECLSYDNVFVSSWGKKKKKTKKKLSKAQGQFKLLLGLPSELVTTCPETF